MTQSIAFNDGANAVKGGLVLDVARNASTYNGQDVLIGADTARYGKDRTIFPREATAATVNHSGSGTYETLAGGVDLDGISPLVLGRETGGASGLWVRSGADLKTQTNVVVGSVDPLSVANRTHGITGAKIIHGLIVTACSVNRTDGPNTQETVTLIYSQNGGATWFRWLVDSGSQWSIDTNYPDPTAGATSASRGNIWAINWFPADDLDEPQDIWITFTDYLNTPKDGGSVYLCRAVRTAVGASWSLQKIRRIYTDPQIGSTQHAHSCGMARDDSGVWHAVVFWGDTNYNHVTDLTIGSSTTGNGGTDYLTATITANDTFSGGTAGSTTVPRSAQPTSCFPMPNGDVAATADNERNTILVIKASSLGNSKAEWYVVGPQGGQGSVSVKYDGTLSLFGNFTLDGLGRCYVARNNPREGLGSEDEKNAIASVDGTHWFQIGDDGMIYIAGPYIVGDVSNQLHTLTRPTASRVRLINPLEIAPGGENILDASLPTTGLNGAVVTEVTDGGSGYLWPTGFAQAGTAMPTPPRPGQVLAFDCSNSTNFEAWAQQIDATDPSGNGTDWMLRVWVLVPQDMADIAFKLWQPGFQINQTRMTGNQWIPLSMVRAWATGDSAAVRVLCDLVSTPVSHPEFAVLLEGAFAGNIPPYWIPTDTAGRPNEVVTVKGINPLSDWSIGVDLNYPDWFDAGKSTGPLMTVYQDATHYVTVQTVDSPSGGAADGFPFDFEVTVQNGVATSAYVNAKSIEFPGAPIRVIVSKVGGDTVLSLQHSGLFPAESATVSAQTIATPDRVRLASDFDGTAVNRLEIAKIASASTAALVGTELDSNAGASAMSIPADLQRKHPITIDATKVGTGGVTNFSVVLQRSHFADEVVDPSGTHAARADGGDLRFSSDAGGANQLACDVIDFAHDSATGAADAVIEVRVMVASISDTTNTTIYAWYDGTTTTAQPAASNAFGSDNAYDANIKVMIPMGPTDFLDRTLNNNNGTAAGTTTPVSGGVTGQVGMGTNFTGSTPRLDIDAPVMTGNMEYTVSIWSKAPGNVASECVYSEARSTSGANPLTLIRADATGAKINLFRRNDVAATIFNITSAATAIDGSFNHIVLVGETGGLITTLYINGVKDTTAIPDNAGTFNNLDWSTVGQDRRLSTNINSWTGDIDDVLLRSAPWSAAEVLTYYNMTATPATFASAGTAGVASVRTTRNRISRGSRRGLYPTLR